MILNKTTEYSLTILSHMAINGDEIHAADRLHEELEIPRRYLRKLMTQLTAFGFIRSAKGRKGGYVFARPLEEISLTSIIQTVEGSEMLGSCLLGHTQCKEEQPCIMHDTWLAARSKMLDVLSGTTLQDLKDRKSERYALKINNLI